MKNYIWCFLLCMFILTSMHFLQGVTNPFSWIYQKIKSCSNMLLLAGKKGINAASYKAKKTFLNLADKLEKVDPRLVSLTVAEKAADAALELAQKTVRGAQETLILAQKGSHAVSALAKQLATATGKGFNIKKAGFEGYLIDFRSSPRVRLTLDAAVLGKHITIDDVELDLLLPAEAIKNIITHIAQQW